MGQLYLRRQWQPISEAGQGATTTYTFDAKNQLIQIPGIVSYSYDAFGRRVEKVSASGTATGFLYGHGGQLLMAYDEAAPLNTNYIYLNGKLIARNQGGTVTYTMTDRQGTPVREASSTGVVGVSFSYDPYGTLSSGPDQQQPGYTGHVYDPETEFSYMQARYQDGAAGRMLSPDPVYPSPGDLFAFNRYAYADNNPIMRTDPMGEYACNGNKSQCSTIKKAISDIGRAAKRLPRGSKGAGILNNILDFYGKEGDENGVVVGFGNTNGNNSITISQGNGKTNIDFNLSGIRSGPGSWPDTTARVEIAAAVAHEGSNGIFEEVEGRPRNWDDFRREETLGFSAQSYVNEGFDTTSPYGRATSSDLGIWNKGNESLAHNIWRNNLAQKLANETAASGAMGRPFNEKSHATSGSRFDGLFDYKSKSYGSSDYFRYRAYRCLQYSE